MCEECPVTCDCCCKDLVSQKHASQYVYSACVGVCVCMGGGIDRCSCVNIAYVHVLCENDTQRVLAKIKVCIYIYIYTAEIELFF